MPRKRLFNTKRATGSAGKSRSAADSSVSSPEAKKPSSASVPPSIGAEVLAEVLEERRSSPVPACTLKLAIPHPVASLQLVTTELYKVCIKWGWIVTTLL